MFSAERLGAEPVLLVMAQPAEAHD